MNKDVKKILQQVIDNIKKILFFANMPSSLHGFTSTFLKIFLRKNYFMIPMKSDVFMAISIINFLHELGHYIRRYFFRGEDCSKINTPSLKDKDLDQNFWELLKLKGRMKAFLNKEFGERLEILLFTKKISYLYPGDVKFLVNLNTKTFENINEFRMKFRENRNTAKSSNESIIKYRENPKKKVALNRGICYFARMRGYYWNLILTLIFYWERKKILLVRIYGWKPLKIIVKLIVYN